MYILDSCHHHRHPPTTFNINVLNSPFDQISLSHVVVVVWLYPPVQPSGSKNIPLVVVMHTKRGRGWDCVAAAFQCTHQGILFMTTRCVDIRKCGCRLIIQSRERDASDWSLMSQLYAYTRGHFVVATATQLCLCLAALIPSWSGVSDQQLSTAKKGIRWMAGLRIVAFSFHYYSQRYPLRLISSVKALPPIKCAPPAAGLVVEKFRYHYQAHLSSFETSVSVYESRIQFGFCCSRTRDGGRWKEKSFIIHLSRLHPRTVDKEEKEWM